MTVSELHLAFKVYYDSVDTQGYPGFEPEEIDLYLNKAQLRFIKQRYGGNNVKRTSFEATQKRIEDLRTIVVTNTVQTVAATSDPNVFSYTLPDGTGTDPKYLFMVSAKIYVNKDECGVVIPDGGTRVVKQKQVTHDRLEEWLDDPFHQPNYDEALIIFEGDKILIYTGGLYDVTGFSISYIKYPDTIDLATNVTSNLPDHTHDEIVDSAVRLCKASVENTNRLNIESQTINEQE